MNAEEPMPKTILITGSTDGIGRDAAGLLASQGHNLILHGRNAERLASAQAEMSGAGSGTVEGVIADLSNLDDVNRMADELLAAHDRIDVLMNNAGVLKTPAPQTADGLDLRFVVNTLAPRLLTRRLLPAIPSDGRIVNLSSAAQSPVSLQALAGGIRMQEMDAYAQSKLAITMWSIHLAQELGADGPMVLAVNPGSLLATKMVKEGFGMEGNDRMIGADILVRAAVSDEFATATGRYWDNDARSFGNPHPDAGNPATVESVVAAVDAMIGLG